MSLGRNHQFPVAFLTVNCFTVLHASLSPPSFFQAAAGFPQTGKLEKYGNATASFRSWFSGSQVIVIAETMTAKIGIFSVSRMSRSDKPRNSEIVLSFSWLSTKSFFFQPCESPHVCKTQRIPAEISHKSRKPKRNTGGFLPF